MVLIYVWLSVKNHIVCRPNSYWAFLMFSLSAVCYSITLCTKLDIISPGKPLLLRGACSVALCNVLGDGNMSMQL